MRPLASGHIDVWLTYYDQINDEQRLAEYRELLNEDERVQAERFYFARDRKRYLVTRALVRTVLSRYASVDPKNWMFSKNEYGRPEISPEVALSTPLTFNLSHTRGLIALALTRQGALGIDVENVSAREASLEIARRFFATEEAEALAQVPKVEQQARFFDYWTFKESYIKARGMGLSIPLNRFSFHFEQSSSVRINIDDELRDSAQRWRFWQIRPSFEHLLAICAERSDLSTQQVSIIKVIPLHTEEPLALPLLRTSA